MEDQGRARNIGALKIQQIFLIFPINSWQKNLMQIITSLRTETKRYKIIFQFMNLNKPTTKSKIKNLSNFWTQGTQTSIIAWPLHYQNNNYWFKQTLSARIKVLYPQHQRNCGSTKWRSSTKTSEMKIRS